jgi:serine/threonine protein phosphatase 1
VVAIGDVHGCGDQFRAALRFAVTLLEEGRAQRLVFLGDLIDRGPSSLACLELASAMRDSFPGQVELLAGNHEQLMLCALYHENELVRNCAFVNWRENGGARFIYTTPNVPRCVERLSLQPGRWKSHCTSGNVLLVHAGVPAGSSSLALEQFLAEPLLWIPTTAGASHAHWAWIRNGFLESDAPVDGQFVVHGHTPRDFTGAPREGRLNLDSHCCKNGILTVGVLSPGLVELYGFGP